MDKVEKMKDGTDVTIRRLTPADIDPLMDFYAALPAEDRRYLKFDVTDRKTVSRRIGPKADPAVSGGSSS